MKRNFTQVKNEIIDVINKLKPFLNSDGGDIEFIKFENNTVFVRLTGACAHCDLIDVTLSEGIEYALKESVPEVKNVVNIK